MNASELKTGIIVRGPVLPEPIEVLVVTPLGDVIKIVGAGQKSVCQYREVSIVALRIVVSASLHPMAV